MRVLLPAPRCALTAPFHPYLCPERPSAVCSLWHFPWTSLQAGRPAGVTRHPCFVEPGLSSAFLRMTRLPGPLAKLPVGQGAVRRNLGASPMRYRSGGAPLIAVIPAKVVVPERWLKLIVSPAWMLADWTLRRNMRPRSLTHCGLRLRGNGAYLITMVIARHARQWLLSLITCMKLDRRLIGRGISWLWIRSNFNSNFSPRAARSDHTPLANPNKRRLGLIVSREQAEAKFQLQPDRSSPHLAKRPYRVFPLSRSSSNENRIAEHSPSTCPSMICGRHRRWKARVAATGSVMS